ncbi:DUF1883 domain-containing protein [Pantoea agglomerans]|uniref:DUF1883 domain-containing protein n=1 Tax=Enterobacter agglomerans TaxID=549 RepID=UPI002413C229|nr:DUF1883 domain-containing protein [Pantoea agglomerans]
MAGDTVVVNCSRNCFVMILTNSEYVNYLNGSGYEYCGGRFKKMPARIKVPHGGEWNVVLNIGKASPKTRSSVSVIHN